MVKKIVKGFILLSIGICVGFAFYYQRFTHKVEISGLRKELSEEKEKNRVYIIRDDRRRCISKTLQLAYGLSKWEAYCYAIFSDEFSILYKTHWELYGSLMRVESNFNPTRKSGKDCKGLMQIKESTGKEVAEKLGIRFVENQSLWNEFINFALGSTYLSEFVVKRGVIAGIKCYLGGPDVLRNVKRKAETFNYVKEYKTRVFKEYKQLSYMYRGVVDEFSITDFEEISNSIYKDSTALILDIFKVETVDTIKGE